MLWAVTLTEDNSGVATPSDEPSEMIYGVGQSAWLAVVTVVAFLGLALGLVALIVAGSDDGGGGGVAADGGGPTGPVTEAEISASEFAFDPSDIELVADEEATVTLANDGAVEHNWTVLEEQVTSEEEIADAPVAGAVDTVTAGETGTGTLTLAEGSYQVVCTIAGHFAAGMEGVVTASAPAA
jgi:hypothetical protein